MLQLSLVSKEAFDNFFATNEIPLQGSKTLSGKDSNALIEAANKISRAFQYFILFSIFDVDFNIQTNFENQDEAYAMYECFMAGFTKQSVNN